LEQKKYEGGRNYTNCPNPEWLKTLPYFYDEAFALRFIWCKRTCAVVYILIAVFT